MLGVAGGLGAQPYSVPAFPLAGVRGSRGPVGGAGALGYKAQEASRV